MDFNQLMMKMRELDQPATEPTAEDCGMPPTSMPPAGMPPKQETPPPSMSVNLNAQGLDNIEDMMKLFQKVNPDMGPMDKPELPPLPSMGMEPNIMSIKPSLPPLKMLPDFDADNDDMPGGEKDHMEPDADNFGGPSDNDADNEPEDKDDEEKKDEWANSPDGVEADPETKGVDAAIPDGNDLNRPKKTYPKVAGADNPMQRMESGDLRAQIRAELLQRLEEAKQK